MFLWAIILGGFMGKYRGGIFNNRDEIVARIKPHWLSRVIYFLVQGDVVNSVAFGLWCAFAVHHDLNLIAVFLYEFILMFRFAAPGWGDYIGAAGGWRLGEEKLPEGMTLSNLSGEDYQRYKPLVEVPYIDKIIEPFIDRPRLWGVVGLSLRCGEWGLMIGAPFLNPFPAIAGLLAGPTVFILSKTLPHRYVWSVFEILLGIGFYATMLICL